MNKNELKLLDSCVTAKNPKRELDYAEIDFNEMCISAIDTRRLIRYNLREQEVKNCKGKHYLHKKILKALITMMEKYDEYYFEDNHIVIHDTKIKLHTVADMEKFKYPETADIINSALMYDKYETSSLMYIDFDTTHKNTHINSDSFKPLQEFADASRYLVSTKPQKEKEVGMVKIEAYKGDDNDSTYKRFEMLMMGIEYIPAQPSLFD